MTAPSFLKIKFVADFHQDDAQNVVLECVIWQLLTKMKTRRFLPFSCYVSSLSVICKIEINKIIKIEIKVHSVLSNMFGIKSMSLRIKLIRYQIFC